MAKKGPMPSFKTVDDYIAHQSDDAQSVLMELRKIIKEAVPEALEIPNSKVPCFTLIPGSKAERQLMIAAYSKYVSFYPSQATIDHFEKELAEFELGKGTVKFPFNQDIPRDLVRRMLEFRKDEVLKDLESQKP